MHVNKGGKTLGLLDIIRKESTLIAMDINKQRFQSLQKFMNIYAPNDLRVTLKCCDATKVKDEKFDAILCDSPCTGSGVISTHDPRTLKYFLNIPEWIEKHVNLQKLLLDAAYLNLDANGILVYSTCSIFVEENENIVEWFLEKYKDIKCIDSLYHLQI